MSALVLSFWYLAIGFLCDQFCFVVVVTHGLYIIREEKWFFSLHSALNLSIKRNNLISGQIISPVDNLSDWFD